MAEIFNVSRPTVRQALNRLTLEGYLIRRKGLGTFVAQPKLLHASTSFIASYRKEAEQQGKQMRTHVIEFEKFAAEDAMVQALQVCKGDSIYKLTRQRWLDRTQAQKPVVMSTVFIPVRLFPQMDQIDFSVTPLYDTLDQNHLKVVHVSRQLEVVMPAAQVADGLEIGPLEPVIQIISSGFLADSTIIEYAQSWYPAASSKFLIELQR